VEVSARRIGSCAFGQGLGLCNRGQDFWRDGMGISVKCPNGHEFKVKDKYAGKKGLCPYCPGQVAVRVPDAVSSSEITKAAMRAAREEHGASTPAVASTASSVFDDPDTQDQDSSTSGSLLSSSVIRHNIKCRCGEKVPMWFARCPKCGEFMQQ
jgi:hypothetical protein